MARRILNSAAGPGRHALPAAPLPHVAAASEPPVAVAWADTDPGAMVCSMSPASRSARGVIDTRSSKPLRNPNASGSRYPAGLWLTVAGRVAANSGRHISVERVPSPTGGRCPTPRFVPVSAHAGRERRKTSSRCYLPFSARCCFHTALISQDLAFAQTPEEPAATSSGFSRPNIRRVTPAGISPPGCVRRMSKRRREASRSNDQKVTVRTVERKVCHS
jgi:hypothetical protein